MKLKIHDYNYKWKTVDIGNIKDYIVIIVRELSGDEVLECIKKDGSTEEFDSSDDRFQDYDDDSHIVYADGKMTDKDWFSEREVNE